MVKKVLSWRLDDEEEYAAFYRNASPEDKAWLRAFNNAYYHGYSPRPASGLQIPAEMFKEVTQSREVRRHDIFNAVPAWAKANRDRNNKRTTRRLLATMCMVSEYASSERPFEAVFVVRGSAARRRTRFKAYLDREPVWLPYPLPKDLEFQPYLATKSPCDPLENLEAPSIDLCELLDLKRELIEMGDAHEEDEDNVTEPGEEVPKPKK